MAESSNIDEEDGVRHSKTRSETLLTDPDEIADKEAQNALLQIDLVNDMIDTGCDRNRPAFRLTSGAILQIHKQTVEGIERFAGTFRNGPIEIGKSEHQPPEAFQVTDLVWEMCTYVNDHWADATALHLAAYILWKMNWIHPFTDGNGRTARAVSYLVLCVKLGGRLPGTTTIPQQIACDRKPYYGALEFADKAARADRLDVSEMESLLSQLLAIQLASIHKEAEGNSKPAA